MGTFLRGTGRGAQTRGMSISSSRRATAGARISIGRRLGPLFGLNPNACGQEWIDPLQLAPHTLLARKQAGETGKMVLARDGQYHGPSTPDTIESMN